jgi:Golgi phosphoprotein 3
MAVTLSLPQALFLLALDEESGRLRDDDHHALVCLNYALAGAVLAELALRNCVSIAPEQVVVLASFPLDEPLLDEALRLIVAAAHPHTARQWVEHLRHALKDLHTRLGDQLATAGIVERTEQRLLGVRHRVRYPLRDPGVEGALDADLLMAALDERESDARTRTLLALAYHAELLDDAFDGIPDAEAEIVAQRLVDLAALEPIAVAVANVIGYIEASPPGGAHPPMA